VGWICCPGQKIWNLCVVNGGGRRRDARNGTWGGIGGGVQGISSQPRGSWLGARMRNDGFLKRKSTRFYALERGSLVVIFY